MNTKICYVCKEEKEVLSFWKLKSSKDGLQYSCKTCMKKAQTKYSKEHKNKIFKKWYIKHKELHAKRVKAWSETKKGRESRRNIHLKYRYGITIKDEAKLFETQNYCCAICKDELSYPPQVDHIISRSSGGENCISNFQLLCEMCNIGKFKYLQEEYIEHCKKVVFNN